jgi:uncharacterized protein YkwD
MQMPGSHGKRRAAVVIVLATSLVLFLETASAQTANAIGYRGRLLKMINNVRERHDLRELRIDRSLSRDAVRHTRRMVEANEVFDPPNLARFLSDEPWERIGASVSGCAGSVRGVHRAWMRHAAHREIMLEPRLRRIGIGVITDRSRNICGRGSTWATELFYG